MYACLFYMGVLARKNKKSRSWFYIGACIINHKEITKVIALIIIGILIGFYIKKPEIKEVVKTEQAQKCSVVVTKVTNKDGSIIEKSEIVAEQKQVTEVKPVKSKKYLAGIKKEYDFLKQQDAIELSLGRKISQDISVVFSYSTNQVAGVGLMVEF